MPAGVAQGQQFYVQVPMTPAAPVVQRASGGGGGGKQVVNKTTVVHHHGGGMHGGGVLLGLQTTLLHRSGPEGLSS